ncbi:glycerol-3-phosphate 1-O-acyltransferase PlsY [Paracoccus sp. S3-43]|uniref:glycerol-3-phosphate 1-O-acyltransferase PlsY n=1 Tax=Paracoccus sp. S3-43 TaxID=3030011 RepID=UPI0023B0A927|nr:glycerol-3-phosphate 1-O-acyltransferase PlsY [Paracoccus sp. S3-43]WEF24082.1 glycerol-3-phosphate 1-O-acyltransferase PlsY [Paracoccus sp. S3-43]
MILWTIFGYLLGSIPFGLVIARALGLGDLRKIGSGNIGATNVLRTGNKPAALATLLLDSGKGAIAVLAARHLGGDTAAMLAGGAAFLGHCFPVWLGFRGGKGVATFLGTLIALHWPLGLIACGVWLLTAAVSRISSLSALLAAALSPVFAWAMGRTELIAVSLFMAVLIFLRHRPNIARLLDGTEPRIGRKG